MGGAPVKQPAFARAILRLARQERVHTNIETCGHVSTEARLSAASLLDSMFIDIKSMNTEKHKVWTGVGNKHILENFIRVRESFPCLPVTIRTPVIPGLNDNASDLEEIARFVSRFTHVRYEHLPYHSSGEPKYDMPAPNTGSG